VCVTCEKSDEGVWRVRPITPRVLDAACKDVKYLCQLRCVLLEKRVTQMGLYTGIDYYINSLRELSHEQFQDYDKLGVKYRQYFISASHNVFCSDLHT